MNQDSVLTDEHRATLAALGSALIPGDAGMPSAADAGVAGHWLDELLRSRPDLGPPLASLLTRLDPSESASTLRDLQAGDPAAFDVLTEAVVGAYFLNPEVRRLAGYPGQLAVPIEVEDPPDYEQDGLLASAVARGPVYRPTPGRVRHTPP